MAQPRFQLVLVARRSLLAQPGTGQFKARTGQRSGSESFVWRLLGANNRELGRSADHFGDVDECERAIVRLKCGYPNDLAPRISFDPEARGWRWQLSLGRDQVANSARQFSRQRECRSSLEQFLAKVPDAAVVVPQPKFASVAPIRPLIEPAKECG